MKYYAGLDAGGTKTHCLISDDTGRVLGFGAAGAGNYEVAGVGAARQEIEQALTAALNEASIQLSDLSAIGLGVAGADIDDDFRMLDRDLFDPVLGRLRRDFKNDSAAALRGGTHNPYGIVIACGTGCVCAGRNCSGVFGRVGGHGEEFGDECSGSSIGAAGLRRVFQAREGIIPSTKMTASFVARAGCTDVDELFHRLYQQAITPDTLEPMAPLVFDAALAGDSAACAILTHGGAYLGSMVNAVAGNLGMAAEVFDVVMAGSVFKGSTPLLIDAMAASIKTKCPNAALVHSVYEPVVGALLMGFDLDNAISGQTYSVLETSLTAIGRRHNVQLKSE
jgi:N-acetylglucosamine kinase-like BadF-type ATPase